MKYEHAKSLILTILVLLSMILSWNILTFQPNNDIKQSNYVEEINIGQKLEISHLIKPSKIIYHDYNDSHHGSGNLENIDLIMNELYRWSFYDFTIPEQVKSFEDTIHGPGRLELIFPSKVPFDIFKNALKVDSKNIPTGTFDRIVINENDIQGEEGVVYFISTADKEVIKSQVRSRFFNEYKEVVSQFMGNAYAHLLYTKANGENLYVLNEEIILQRYRYYPQYISVDQFKKALFPNPEFVTRTDNEYTDSSSLLNVNEPMIEYVDPTNRNQILTPSEVLQMGINYVNSHAGWTDTYIFDDLQGNSVAFRLYLHDYFVVNDLGISINSLHFDNKWFKYKRSYLRWDIPLPQNTTEIPLVPGYKVMEYIQNSKTIKINEVQDIAVGYYLTKNVNDQLYYLEPSWFYRVNGTWKRISAEELGGVQRGLE